MSENVHSLPHRDLKGHWLQLFMPTALWWTLTLARMLLTRQTGPTTYSEAVQTESCLTITETSDKYRELHFSLCRLPPTWPTQRQAPRWDLPHGFCKGPMEVLAMWEFLVLPAPKGHDLLSGRAATQNMFEWCTKVFKGSPPPAHALHSGPLHYVPGPCQWLSSQGWLTWWRRDMGSFWLRAKVKAFHLIQKKNHVEVRTRVGERTSGILYNPSSLSLPSAIRTVPLLPLAIWIGYSSLIIQAFLKASWCRLPEFDEPQPAISPALATGPSQGISNKGTRDIRPPVVGLACPKKTVGKQRIMLKSWPISNKPAK